MWVFRDKLCVRRYLVKFEARRMPAPLHYVNCGIYVFNKQSMRYPLRLFKTDRPRLGSAENPTALEQD